MPLIVEMLGKTSAQFKDSTALRAKISGRWVDYSYGEIWHDSDQIAAGLDAVGFEAGERAAVLAPSSPAWVKSYLGILKSNGIVVPIDKELKHGELRHILNDSAAKVLFTEEAYLKTILDIIDELPSLRKIVLLNQPAPQASKQMTPQAQTALSGLITEWQRLTSDYKISDGDASRVEALAEALQQELAPEAADSALDDAKEGFFTRILTLCNKENADQGFDVLSCQEFACNAPPPQLSGDQHDPAVILYTSGTTGRAKGAMLSHNNITSNVEAAIEAFELTSEMHTLSFLPINHVFEQVVGILLPLTVGGKASFAESLRKIGDNLGEVKPNYLLGVPAVFRLLADRMTKKIDSNPVTKALFSFPLTKPLITKKVRAAFGGDPIFVSGGAALDPAVAARLLDLGLRIYQGYGVTETSPIISVETPRVKKLGTTGRTVPGVEVKIHQPNAEGVGEIWAKGPNIMLGYYNNPQATAEVFTNSWYHTGDLGKFDQDGLLSICGRVKNLIVTANGKNVYPEEIENELLNSSYIAEIMVFGHKSDGVAEEVHAMIFPDQDALDALAKEQDKSALSSLETEALIKAEVLERGKQLADYKRVRRFTLRNEEFPKTTTRKIKRFAVEADIEAED